MNIPYYMFDTQNPCALFEDHHCTHIASRRSCRLRYAAGQVYYALTQGSASTRVHICACGWFDMRDRIRPEAKEFVARLKHDFGMKVLLFSGDCGAALQYSRRFPLEQSTS